jgi:nucleotide-binding universal stress UspA family protein
MMRVLAAIDDGPQAGAVVEAARAVAEPFQAALDVLHVRLNGSDAAHAIAREEGVELAEAAGDPVEAIVAAAEARDVVAVVLGSRGRGGPRPAGQTALQVITRLRKPVVVVPPEGGRCARVTRVLVPLEGTDESSRAMGETIALAARRDIEILVLHVHAPDEVPPFQDRPYHEIPAWEQEFVARFASIAHARVEVIERVGAAADRVVPVARETDADLIALGWSQDLSPGRGAVVREVLASSAVPVLLVPAA